MTGFGRGACSTSALGVEVEIKSLNSRFLDLIFRLPREYSIFEMELRDLIASKLQRGRVEVHVTRKAVTSAATALQFNRALFDAHLKIAEDLLGELGCPKQKDRSDLVRDILSKNEIVEMVEVPINITEERQVLLEAITKTLQQLCVCREREGQKTGEDLKVRLGTLSDLAKKISEGAQTAPAQLREKLQQRIKKLAPEVLLDPQRLAQEVAILSDRVDVSEELMRLSAHIGEFDKALSQKSSGRKLDFLVQELSRELNTIGSKAQDSSLQGLVVEGKSVLEKLKEQVQNVE